MATVVTDQKIRQLENFARHLREGEELRSRPADAVRALRVIEAAYASAARGLPVSLGTDWAASVSGELHARE